MDKYQSVVKCNCNNCRRFLVKLATDSDLPILIVKCKMCLFTNVVQVKEGYLKIKSMPKDFKEPSGDLEKSYIDNIFKDAYSVNLNTIEE